LDLYGRLSDGQALYGRGVGHLLNLLRMSVLFPVNDGVESIVSISGVVHGTPGTVGFDEGVAALDRVAVPRLLLALDVSGVAVVDGVLELVLGVRVYVVDLLVLLCCHGPRSYADGCHILHVLDTVSNLPDLSYLSDHAGPSSGYHCRNDQELMKENMCLFIIGQLTTNIQKR
jgi:hypothetical protein